MYRRLDIELWLDMMKVVEPRRTEHQAAQMFMLLDDNKSGSIGNVMLDVAGVVTMC